jgi:hypothetical protein
MSDDTYRKGEERMNPPRITHTKEMVAEIERLKAALRNIIKGNNGECGCAESARAALEGK